MTFPPEPEFPPVVGIGDDSPNGQFDISSVVSEPAPEFKQEPVPNASASRRSFKDWFRGKPKQPKKRKPTPPMPKKGIAGGLQNMYTGLGMTVAMVDKQCGMAIVESAEDCAEAWEDLAKTNPKVRRALLMLLETSDIAKIAIAHAPIMAAVMAHHVPLVREQQLKVVEMFANQGSEETEPEE